MVYTVKVKYYCPENEDGTQTDYLFMWGDSYEDVSRKICKYCGEDAVESMKISCFASYDGGLIFEKDGKKLFNEVKDYLSKTMW